MEWIDKLGLVVNTTVPRAWVIPYTRQMHKQLRGLDEQRKGGTIAVKIGKKKGKGESHTGTNEERQKFVPYILPENFKLEKTYKEPEPVPLNEPTADGWLGGESLVSPDGTPDTNNNTQEQQLPTDRGGSTNVIP